MCVCVYSIASISVHDINFVLADCYSHKEAELCHELGNDTIYFNRTCHNRTSPALAHLNLTESIRTMVKRPPAEDYFESVGYGLRS